MKALAESLGVSLPAMSLGGFLAGVTTALGSGIIARFSSMREDASFAAAYLTAMALGVLIVSMRGSAVDLMNILFGAILAVDTQALLLIAGTATMTLVGLAAIYRPLVVECFNPGFLAAMGVKGALYQADMGFGFHPFRRDVAWHDAQSAPLAALQEELAFTQEKNWGYRLRQGLVEISDADMTIIAAAMFTTSAAPRRPADEMSRGSAAHTSDNSARSLPSVARSVRPQMPAYHAG